MKTLKLFLLIAVVTTFSQDILSAQTSWVRDSMFWAKPALIDDLKIIDWNSTYAVDKSFVMAAPAMSNKKKLAAPSKGLIQVKKLKTPFKIRSGRNCYAITCVASKECKECNLYWKDLNGDKKVQPRKELRCLCESSKRARCRMTAKKVPCK